MIEISQTRVRRRDRRWRWLALAVFVAVFLFVFLAQGSRKEESEVQAASLANFDPGYIISDYQMGNYNSMNEAEIQAWLTSKNSCPNTNYDYYLQLSANTNYTWHWENGHFVCLSEELFGDGEVIGSGETAAHIIWQTAQDYHINPQVILVLLQKETGLITDPIPNNGDYRKATGYGCPDTAPCSSQYYGFKNQVRKAAALFRTVLDGGWTNYPLGDNYIQYNPSTSCGGSVVNIRSLATSALYRYTPYQPNEGALAAGYGTAYCGAYGNRNFYLYFEDWFGGITRESALYVPLDNPRYMEVVDTVNRINSNMEIVDTIEGGRILKFMTKTILPGGEMCLRSEFGTLHDEDICIPFSALKNVEFEIENLQPTREMLISSGAEKTYIRGGAQYNVYKQKMVRVIVAQISFLGKDYYVTEYDHEKMESEYGFEAKFVEELPSFEELEEPVIMGTKKDSQRVNPVTGEYYNTLPAGMLYKFTSTIVVDGVKYYRTEHNTIHNLMLGVSEDDLEEVNFIEMELPGNFRLKREVNRINAITGELYDILKEGRIIRFASKILINDKWYYRTEHNTVNNLALVIAAEDLERCEN